MPFGRDSREDSDQLAGRQTYQQYAEGLAQQGLTFDPRVGRVVTQAEFDQNHAGDNGNLLAKILAVSAPFIAGGIGALATGGAGAAAAGGVPSVGAASGLSAGAFPSIAGTSGAAGAAGTTAAAGAAAKGASMLPFGMKDILGVAPSLLGMFSGHGNNTPPQNDAMNELIGMQTQRLKESDPLYQAILRMAMGLLPISARGGMGGSSPMPSQQPPAQPRRIR